MNKTLDILKMAILMERRGRVFYVKVAEQSENEEVKKIFQIMADEEILHEQFLSEQFALYETAGEFDSVELPKEPDVSITNTILSPEITGSISAAGFEAAAISAAIDMETKAISVYTERAESASDPNEKKLYAWLAGWERSHHALLLELDNKLKEQIWYDNQFWPF